MDPVLKHIGRRQIHLDVTDSTNARAAELAGDLAYAGTVITAGLQSQGRGQHGRVWQSSAGVNVLLSTLLFPPLELCRPPVFTAWAAVAVGDTILQAAGLPSTIKWPNDVLLGGKKVCGILIEGGVVPAPHFVAGIGLNVNPSADDFVRMGLPGATSLSAEVGRSFIVTEVTQLLVQNLDARYDQLLRGRLDEMEESWARRIGLVGRPVTAELMDASTVQGRLTAIGFGAVEMLQPDGAARQLRPEEIRHLR